MGLYSFYRISKPSETKVPEERVLRTYRRLRSRTFWGAVAAYSLYYVCRMTLSVVKGPIIDGGILTAGQLGVIGSAMLLVYAVGKFVNGFIADYCNIKRFMATGLLASAAVNLILGCLGLLHTAISTPVIFIAFALLWGVNGWAQSMGSPPGVISLSRWFPLSARGSYYSLFSATPYIGKAVTFVFIGAVAAKIGWQFGFLFAALGGLVGAVVVVVFVSDNPESQGLPTVQELSGETPAGSDSKPTRVLQKSVITHPGIWVIALSSAFVYITQYAVSGWGVLFLQKSKAFSLEASTQIVAFSEAFGIVGTILAGWLSDKVFKGNRVLPVIISGLLCFASLGLFLFSGGGYFTNIFYVALFSLAIGVLYCIVAGLMALDIVPRKATGAALGIVGISSYVAAGLQDIVSGLMIQHPDGGCDFTGVRWFWIAACVLAIVLPVIGWGKFKNKIN